MASLMAVTQACHTSGIAISVARAARCSGPKRPTGPAPARSEVLQGGLQMLLEKPGVRQCLGIEQGELDEKELGLVGTGLVDGLGQRDSPNSTASAWAVLMPVTRNKTSINLRLGASPIR